MRAGQGRGAADQCDEGAGLPAGLGQCIAHFAGRQVGDAAHRVDGLVGGAGRHQDALALQGLWSEEIRQLLDQHGGFQHPAGANLAAGLLARIRTQYLHAIGTQLVDVALGGRVLPHLPVHGRCHQQRDVAGQAQGGEQIVTQAMGHLGQKIGRCRGDDDGIGVAAQFDVGHAVVDAGVEGAGEHRFARQRLEGGGADEMGGSPGHHHLHAGAGPLQVTHQLCGLVGGHTAGHAQHQMAACQWGRR